MQSEDLNTIVYSKNVVEFVTVANNYCDLIENATELDCKNLNSTMLKVLPLLYLKAQTLPKVESLLSEEIERFVTEEDYYRVQHTLLNIYAENDDYLEVFVPDNYLEEQNVASSISENLSDIYQFLKDFVSAYRISQEDIMHEALFELNDRFELYWGQKTVNVLRACHMLSTKLNSDSEF